MTNNDKRFADLLTQYIAKQCDADNQKRSKLITVSELSQAYDAFVFK